MSIDLQAGEAPVTLKAVYVDKAGNPTAAPAGVTLTWSDSNPATATLDATNGETVHLAPVGALGATTDIVVTDGTLISDPDTAIIIAGPASKLVIQVVPAA